MSIFEVFTKEVEVETVSGKLKLKLKPLNGSHLPKLYKILRTFSSDVDEEDKTKEISTKEFMEKLSEETISDLHKLVFETLKKSYPKEDETELDEFASQNLMALFPAVVDVNMNNKPK